WCGKHGYMATPDYRQEVEDQLRNNYEDVLRKDFQKQEQARIKAQIREEQKIEREREREIKRLENEQAAIEQALQKALKEAEDVHTEEVGRLQVLLREAEEKAQRAKSRAELTRSGHVYVLSNIGSFGEGVFKIGMTRRDYPMDRVKELGDASVPFPFDVHAMISCDDAPKLENTLHREFHKLRLNKVNLRREFFKIGLDTIVEEVRKHHGEVDYVAEPEALQYRESISMTDDEYDYISEQMMAVEGRRGNSATGDVVSELP
ncbi:GIY-YIG nuclease family protein, partial [Verrucomicrobiota bacterium]